MNAGLSIIEARGVYKKFRRGDRHDSLRDLIPALWKKMTAKAGERSSLTRQEFWALLDVNFALQRGEAVGIVGHNGAGKSTLLKHLTGILRPTAGSIHVRGRVSALIEIGAGFHPDLTGRENVYLNGVILGMKLREVRAKFDEIVAFADMEEFIDTPVKRYSSGMFAKLGFSVAAHLDPEILLIDEVLSVGDFVFQQKGVQKMKSIAANGATVVFVSHNIKSITELCSRSLLLDHGRLVQDGPTSDVIQGYMRLAEESRDAYSDAPVRFGRVTLRGRNGEQSFFSAGEEMLVDVEMEALQDCSSLEVALRISDESFYQIASISTGRLGVDNIRLHRGEMFRGTFSTRLHLCAGTYQIGIAAVRMDIQHDVAARMPAATIVVNASLESRGVVNLYPRFDLTPVAAQPLSSARA